MCCLLHVHATLTACFHPLIMNAAQDKEIPLNALYKWNNLDNSTCVLYAFLFMCVDGVSGKLYKVPGDIQRCWNNRAT